MTNTEHSQHGSFDRENSTPLNPDLDDLGGIPILAKSSHSIRTGLPSNPIEPDAESLTKSDVVITSSRKAAIYASAASNFVTWNQLKAFLSSLIFARHQSLNLSIHVTIHWQANPSIAALAKSLSPAEMDRVCAKHRTRLLDKLHQWLEREGIPVAYAWVNEVGKTYGEHSHVFVHLPHFMRYGKGTRPERYAAWVDLKDRLEAYLYQAGSFKDYENRPDHRNKAIKLTCGQFGMHSAKMIGGAAAYLVKGLSPNETIQTGFGRVPLVDFLRVRHKANARQMVGRRYGYSHSISPKAQRDAGFTAVRTVEDVYAVLYPPKS